MIVVTARMRDEEDNVRRFCQEYGKIADMIVLADGGSLDNSVEVASHLNRVKVIHFEERIEAGNTWYNPQGKQANFAIKEAERLGAEWILYDDMDSVPNKILKDAFPSMIARAESYKKNCLYASRAYIYGTDQWFPKMSRAGTVLWGWRAAIGFRFVEEGYNLDFTRFDEVEKITRAFPHALMHYFAPNEEAIKQKLEYYSQVRDHPMELHPREFGGPLAALPEWGEL
jgi:GT2 family glycosyltransferase